MQTGPIWLPGLDSGERPAGGGQRGDVNKACLPSSLHPPINNEHSTRLFDSLIVVNRFQPAGHKLSDPPGPSNTAENILNLLPPLAPNTRHAPKHILRVDSALDLEQTGVVVAPERFLPVRLVPRSLDFQQVNSRITDSTQKNHHHSPR